jgi:hypothetical protein
MLQELIERPIGDIVNAVPVNKPMAMAATPG